MNFVVIMITGALRTTVFLLQMRQKAEGHSLRGPYHGSIKDNKNPGASVKVSLTENFIESLTEELTNGLNIMHQSLAKEC